MLDVLLKSAGGRLRKRHNVLKRSLVGLIRRKSEDILRIGIDLSSGRREELSLGTTIKHLRSLPEVGRLENRPLLESRLLGVPKKEVLSILVGVSHVVMRTKHDAVSL